MTDAAFSLSFPARQGYAIFLRTAVSGAAAAYDLPLDALEDLREAAMLASYFSQAKESSSVPVDYCPVKFVKKPAGARPGMVTYDNYRTLYVTPEEGLAKKLFIR